MGVSSKKKQKHDQQSIQSSQKQGMAQMNTPPTGQYIEAPNMNTTLSQSVTSSSIIGQSNDILYGSQGNQGSQMPCQMPFSPQIFDQQSSQDQRFVQNRTQMHNMPNINNNTCQQPIQLSQHEPVQMAQMNMPTSPLSYQNQTSTPQLTNILQSLDNRLSKIENQLGYQSQQMGNQNTRIQNIERHVEQITVLKQSVSQIQAKVCYIENDLTHIKSKQTEYEKNVETYSSMCDDVLKSQVATNERISAINNKVDYLLSTEIENMKSDHNDLKEDFLDTKSRQMCENLIFTGINEVYLNPGEVENCEQTLREFLSRQMNIQDQEIQFDRVHRLGRYKRNHAFPRPIIAKFHSFKSKEMVKQKAPSTLKNTNYGVREQYPDEYERRRKVLYPTMKNAKLDKDNKVKMVRDTLYINNDKYKCGPNNRPMLIPSQNYGPSMRSQINHPASQGGARFKDINTSNVWPISSQQSARGNNRYSSQQHHQQTPAYDTESFKTGYTPTPRNSFKQPSFSNTDYVPTQNRYLPLSEPAGMGGKHIVGKHQASSPIDLEQSNKKHREEYTDNEQTYMTVPPSPTICATQNISMESNNSSLVNPVSPANTQLSQSVVNKDATSSSQPLDNSRISGLENHVNSQPVVREDNQT